MPKYTEVVVLGADDATARRGLPGETYRYRSELLRTQAEVDEFADYLYDLVRQY